MPHSSNYMTLKDLAAALGAGSEKIIVDAHSSGKITLTGLKCVDHEREPRCPIPKHFFTSDTKIYPESNLVGADAENERFSDFESALALGLWKDVRITSGEASELIKSLNGKRLASARDERVCYDWLMVEIKEKAPDGRSRRDFFHACCAQHLDRKIGLRAFGRAWERATRDAERPDLNKRGAKSKRLKPYEK